MQRTCTKKQLLLCSVWMRAEDAFHLEDTGRRSWIPPSSSTQWIRECVRNVPVLAECAAIKQKGTARCKSGVKLRLSRSPHSRPSCESDDVRIPGAGCAQASRGTYAYLPKGGAETRRCLVSLVTLGSERHSKLTRWTSLSSHWGGWLKPRRDEGPFSSCLLSEATLTS